MKTLILQTLPPSTNALYVTKGPRYMTAAARSLKQSIAWEASVQYREPICTGPLGVRITIYWPNNRRRDVDNIKGLIDALTGVLWVDDSQITDLILAKRVDAKNPRVEISFL